MKTARFLRAWFLLSVPLGLLVGRFIKAGKGPDLRSDHRPSDRP